MALHYGTGLTSCRAALSTDGLSRRQQLTRSMPRSGAFGRAILKALVRRRPSGQEWVSPSHSADCRDLLPDGSDGSTTSRRAAELPGLRPAEEARLVEGSRIPSTTHSLRRITTSPCSPRSWSIQEARARLRLARAAQNTWLDAPAHLLSPRRPDILATRRNSRWSVDRSGGCRAEGHHNPEMGPLARIRRLKGV